MNEHKTWSPAALNVCIVCDWAWTILVFAACTYVVFWLNQSGWWFLLAAIMAGAWNCKHYRSPEQIEADKDEEDDD